MVDIVLVVAGGLLTIFSITSLWFIVKSLTIKY